MDSARDILIKDLASMHFIGMKRAERLADYIIDDRKRICKPLVTWKFQENSSLTTNCDNLLLAREKTLRNAGLE